MGCYINPVNGSKELFLQEKGTLTDPAIYEWDGKSLPVCLVDNGGFTAAAVCYDKNEMSRFTRKDDFRPKLWFKVEMDLLLQTCPDLKGYLMSS